MTTDEPPDDVWHDLPRLSRRAIELERRVEAWRGRATTRSAFEWLASHGLAVDFEHPEVELRASALGRPGLVARLRWPRLRTRMAIGVEIPIVHAVVDRLLGFDRSFAETRHQVTPVEWGVWTFLVSRCLERIVAAGASPFRFGGRAEDDAFDVSVDRVGPSAFDGAGLGEVATIRWTVRTGDVAGAVRLWLPSSLARYWTDAGPEDGIRGSFPPGAADSASEWRAVAGTSPMPLGLGRLRIGAVLPMVGSRLSGAANAPSGELDLQCRAGDDSEYLIPVEIAPGSSGRRVLVAGRLVHLPFLTGDVTMSAEPNRTASPVVDPMDAPVTLTVELGRITLPVCRLAGLKGGDVLELNRHGREPVEISSNGRVVARGDLVLIDSELGVRVTSVFL